MVTTITSNAIAPCLLAET